jgi:hypothetical protein
MFAPESSSCEIINEILVPFYNRFHAGMIDNPLGNQVEHVQYAVHTKNVGMFFIHDPLNI